MRLEIKNIVYTDAHGLPVYLFATAVVVLVILLTPGLAKTELVVRVVSPIRANQKRVEGRLILLLFLCLGLSAAILIMRLQWYGDIWEL
jgi:hypothetical protein